MPINIPKKYSKAQPASSQSNINNNYSGKSLKKFFDINKIGTGKYFTAGRETGKRKGLWGALKNFKGSGKKTFSANLSHQDLKKFHNLISAEMEKTPTFSKQGLSLAQKRKILYRADQMAKKGEISMADKADLRNIVNQLSGARVQPSKKNKDFYPRSKNKRPTILKSRSGGDINDNKIKQPLPIDSNPIIVKSVDNYNKKFKKEKTGYRSSGNKTGFYAKTLKTKTPNTPFNKIKQTNQAQDQDQELEDMQIG